MSKTTDCGADSDYHYATGRGSQMRRDLGGLVLFLVGVGAGLLAMLWVGQRRKDVACPMVHETDWR